MAMEDPKDKHSSPAPPLDTAIDAAQIEALMALPVKARPAVTVFGDADVVGFDPAPAAPRT